MHSCIFPDDIINRKENKLSILNFVSSELAWTVSGRSLCSTVQALVPRTRARDQYPPKPRRGSMHCRYTSSSIANTIYNTLDGNLSSTPIQICKVLIIL